jgi:hypothetical protein
MFPYPGMPGMPGMPGYPGYPMGPPQGGRRGGHGHGKPKGEKPGEKGQETGRSVISIWEVCSRSAVPVNVLRIRTLAWCNLAGSMPAVLVSSFIFFFADEDDFQGNQDNSGGFDPTGGMGFDPTGGMGGMGMGGGF